jgi:hypothetical protein
MTFGPYSNNPRERRSYAYAMLTKARRSEETADLAAAQAAVASTGSPHKPRRRNLEASLFNIAVRDEPTAHIVEVGRLLIDPRRLYNSAEIERRGREYTRRGIYSETSVSMADVRPGSFIHMVCDFTFDRGEDRIRPTGLEVDCKFQDPDSGEKSYENHVIPIRAEVDDIDAVAVRLTSDDVRARMDSLMSQFIMIKSES